MLSFCFASSPLWHLLRPLPLQMDVEAGNSCDHRRALLECVDTRLRRDMTERGPVRRRCIGGGAEGLGSGVAECCQVSITCIRWSLGRRTYTERHVRVSVRAERSEKRERRLGKQQDREKEQSTHYLAEDCMQESPRVAAARIASARRVQGSTRAKQRGKARGKKGGEGEEKATAGR